MRVFLLLCPIWAHAQFTGYSSPQGVVLPLVTNATAPQTVTIATNLGQNVHQVTYKVAGGPNGLQMRLEASYDNSNWFQISDDATDTTGGQIFASGYYPYLRFNLLECLGCTTGISVTANYSGTSSSFNVPTGAYNPSQQIRKIVVLHAAANANQIVTIPAPYGSSAGIIILNCETSAGAFAACPASSTLTLTHIMMNFGTNANGFNIGTGVNPQIFLTPAAPATAVLVNYTSGGASANFINISYVFYPPGAAVPSGAQPPIQQNSQSTSAANSSVAITLGTVPLNERAHLFSVSARCSAGTASLTVQDGATTIWTSAATEVGTTTFRFQWNPGLASSAGNNMVITLGTCGVSNTGTLQVQGSLF